MTFMYLTVSKYASKIHGY